jgi:hypothetical protein
MILNAKALRQIASKNHPCFMTMLGCSQLGNTPQPCYLPLDAITHGIALTRMAVYVAVQTRTPRLAPVSEAACTIVLNSTLAPFYEDTQVNQ